MWFYLQKVTQVAQTQHGAAGAFTLTLNPKSWWVKPYPTSVGNQAQVPSPVPWLSEQPFAQQGVIRGELGLL